MFVTDDGAVNTRVGEMLRAFLPPLFPGRFEEGREPEREWVRVFLFYAILPRCSSQHRRVSWAIQRSKSLSFVEFISSAFGFSLMWL
jgi:hypothetical protein